MTTDELRQPGVKFCDFTGSESLGRPQQHGTPQRLSQIHDTILERVMDFYFFHT